MIALASTNYFFFLSHSDKIYDAKNGSADLQFQVMKSFEITKANIDKIFSEGNYLYMTDSFGLMHRMDVEEICLRESDMTPEQLKKKELATRRRLRGISYQHALILIGLKGAALEEAKSPNYVDLSSIRSCFVAQEDAVRIEGFDNNSLLILTHGNKALLVDREKCKFARNQVL